MTYDQNALRWTSADVLSDVRRKASLPSTSTDYTDAVLLREATDALWSFAGWALAQAGEGRALAFLNRSTLTGGLLYPVGGSSRLGEVALPALAIADTVSNVIWVDNVGTGVRRLSQEDPATAEAMFGVDSGDPTSYALYEGRIKLYPLPTTGGAVRINYQRRHAELVVDSTANVATIITVGGPGFNVFTTNATGNSLGLTVGDEVDIYLASSPHRLMATGLTVTLVSGADISLNINAATQLQGVPVTGSRICRAGQSPYVSMPLELRPALSEKIAANVLRIVGDLQGMQAAEQAATLELSRVMQLLAPRAKRDKPKAINWASLLRRTIRGG